MQFNDASAVEQICWQFRLADYPRSLNRAKINSLFNGVPPFTDDEVAQNNIGTNVNFLEATKIAHDARRQFSAAFCSPDPLFKITLDYGPQWKQAKWASIIQKEMNRVVKDSLEYLELRRSTFASCVLHGIGPVIWQNEYSWRPTDLGVEDVFVPSNTKIDMANLPLFAIYRQYTAPQLMKMTRGRNVDPAWNKPLLKRCLKWVDDQSTALMSNGWPTMWQPEKMAERLKGDGGIYSSDAVPTVDCFDFYFYDDDGEQSGWKRRIILDAWGDPGAGGIVESAPTLERDDSLNFSRGKFLYDSGDRIVASKLSEIMHFQFADGSSVAPFRYHTVRSLGFLLYAVCHLQNRIRSKFNDAVFESLLQYFRVSNPQDMDKVLKIDLMDKGVIDEGVSFVKSDERWKVDQALVEQAMGMNRQTMADNSSSFTQDFDFDSKNADETATRTMAKVNSTTALVGAMLGQAYNYQKFQYSEIGRRFCIKDSRDLDVKRFRVRCLKQGVPEEALNSELWDIQPVRVIGSGNPIVAGAVADKLMAIAPQLNPTAQNEVKRMYIAANSDDYDLAERLVPDQPHISDTIHDSELAFGAILNGAKVTPKPGLNPVEVCEVFITQIKQTVQKILQSDGIGTPDQVTGLYGAAQYCDSFIKMLSQDVNEKERVAFYGKELGKIMNEVKAFNQRQQEQAAKAAQSGNGLDPEVGAKIAALQAETNAKIEFMKQSHAEKSAQKKISFEQKISQDQQKHALELEKTIAGHGADAIMRQRESKLKSEIK